MNIYIKKIMDYLKVDKEMAQEIFDGMSVDLSECSNIEFLTDARNSYDAIKMTKGKTTEEIQAMLRKLYGINGK